MPRDRKESMRKYYEANRDKLLAKSKAYHDANREEVNIKKRKRRIKNNESSNFVDRVYYVNNYRNVMLNSAKARSRLSGHEIDIDIDDIIIPDRCPLLGTLLQIATGRKSDKSNSPSLDRIDSTKGYVKGNVWVISHRANVMKSNATLDEHILLVENWKQQHSLGYPTPELSERFKKRDT